MDKPEAKHLLAEKKIREIIDTLKVGDKLPGERVLASEIGISYMTTRKAVEHLVSIGLLSKVPKKGTYVASHSVTVDRTRNIGYFLDSSIIDGITSPYYSLIFNAIEKEAALHGYSVIYFTEFNGPASLKKMDGVIASCFPRTEKITSEMRILLPVVCIDNSVEDASIPSVTIDNLNPVFESVNYLCFLGHEAIGFITGLDDSSVGRNRLAGYRNALKSRGIEENPDLIYKGDYSFGTGTSGADYFLSLEERPTAIVCANDTMAIGAIKELNRRGLRVPEDISIIGFDDINIATQITPSLTTVSAPVREVGKQSVNMLIEMINGKEPENSQVTLPCRLLLRDSCAGVGEVPADNAGAAPS